MTIKRFEEIEAWKLARQLVKKIYEKTQKNPAKNDFRFCSQIQSAGVSIMSNIAEGFLAQSKKEFIQFLSYAIRSSAEVQSLLYVGSDAAYFSQDDFQELFDLTTTAAKKATAFRNYLKGSDGFSVRR